MNRLKQKRNRGVLLTALGLEKLKSARINWENKYNFGERYTYEKISELTNLDINTIKKILGGKVKVDKRSLEKFFFAFDLKLSKELYTKEPNATRQDWGEAISIDYFFGRTGELATIGNWIEQERCRLIAIQGMGGIGKTTLALKFARQTTSNFDCLIWKSLRDAPPLKDILSALIEFLSQGKETENNLPQRISARITLLIKYLRSQRCLIILDNAESVLERQSHAGKYLPGYEDYGELISRIGSTKHHSCLMLTTREKPKEIATLEGENLLVRSLLLGGLNEASSEIFKLKSLEASKLELDALRDRYGGNPLALKVVATTIKDLFAGNIGKFLAQDKAVFGDIKEVLDRQFERLLDLEIEIMYWLAIAREPVSLNEIQRNLVEKRAAIEVIEALESLSRRSLIEKNAAKFTQQPVVMEYVTARLIEISYQEIIAREPQLFNNYPLLQATAKEYVSQNQSRLILQPLIGKLQQFFDCQEDLDSCLKEILLDLQQTSTRKKGYTAGNIINLLCQMQVDLTGFDFSNLCVWQADLRQVELHCVSFQNSDLSQSIFAENFGGIWSVAFSPDGKYLAAGDTKGDIILRRMSDSAIVCRFTGHSGWVVSLDFSPDGNVLASSSCDCTVKLWDVNTGQCIHSSEHKQEVWSVAFSPDGQYLASGCDDSKARLWNTNNGECLQVFEGHSSEVLAVVFSWDEEQLITGSQDSTIRFWNLKTKKCQSIFRGHEDGIRSLSLSFDGRILASGSCDRTIRLWDIEKEECVNIFRGHDNVVLCVNFASQDNILASSSIDKTVRLWNIEQGELWQILHGHNNVINSVAFHPEDNILASGSYDQTVKLWNLYNQQCFKTWQGYSNQILSVSFSPDNKTFISGGHDSKVRIWDLETGEVIKTLLGHTDWIFSTIFAPNGKLIASSSGDKSVKLWDLQSGKIIKTFLGHEAAIRTIAFDRDSLLLASGSDDCTVKLWDMQTGTILHTLTGHKGEIWSVAFSPDNTMIASASFDCTVKLWSVKTGECLASLEEHHSWVWSIAFSPDNQTLASASIDQTIKFWNLKTKECQITWQDNIGNVQLLTYTLDGEIIITCNQENTIRFWHNKNGKCLHIISQHQALITSINLSLDGRNLISSSEDETIKLWNLKNKELIKTYTLKNVYQSMNIIGIDGLTLSNINSLKFLGAIDNK